MAAAPVRTGPLDRSARHAWRVVERNVLVYRHSWLIVASGFAEPVLYLLAMSVGVGQLIGDVPGPGGEPISYAAFVAPGLLAGAAMNGSLSESTFQLFRKIIDGRSYQAMLATPITVGDVAVGELCWGVLRGTAYATGFLALAVALGSVASWWAVLSLPAAALVALAFAAAGQAATAHMRGWHDLDLVGLVMLPLFLCSGTIFPLSAYPGWLAEVVAWTPLYQGVALERSLTTGHVGPGALVHVAYLVAMAAGAMWLSVRQLHRRLVR